MSAARHPSRVAETPVLPERGPGPVKVTLTVNSTEHALEIEPRVSLLDALRERLHLTGAKKGCDQGTCGACTVWVDQRRTLSCLTLAITCEGREVTTVGGLAEDGEPHPINNLPLTRIEDRPDGGLYIGALARMSDVAEAPMVRERFPLVREALVLGAFAQLRNMAGTGGNMVQRTRCASFRDAASPRNKREPGSGCGALDGFNRGHAVLGVSDHCIATHPSDVAVPLTTLDARVHTEGPRGRRVYALDDFFPEPGDTPHLEHPIEHGELVVGIEVPGMPAARTSLCLKVRDRESYEFALASVAAVVPMNDGVIGDVRPALGDVATTPWRARRAEKIPRGAPAGREVFERAAREELLPARTTPLNAFKVELARRTMVRALEDLL